MRTRWYFLAALAAVLAAVAVWVWPAGPLWTSGPDAGRLEGFSPDGRTLVTSWEPPWSGDGWPDPEVRRWDARTGALLSRVTFPCTDLQSMKPVRPSLTGDTALVGEGRPLDPTRAGFEAGEWYLHDGATGRRTVGPIRGVSFVPPAPFSPDGRWFWAPVFRDDDPLGGFQAIEGISIFSAATGEMVIRARDRNGRRPGGLHFAPDGESAAVLWVPAGRPGDTARYLVQIVDMPSGRDRRVVELPDRPWVRIDRWDGRRLRAVFELASAPPNRYPRRACIFDLAQDPVGEGTEDSPLTEQHDGGALTYWLDGDAWLVYVTILRRTPGQALYGEGRDWLARRVGMRPLATGARVTVRVADRDTGDVRYGIPHPLGHPVMVSPDGRLIACRAHDHGVEVWDANPPPRWPKAIVAAMAAAAGVLALARWRSRRRRSGTAVATEPQQPNC
jgi:hypothetical protein